MTYITPSSVYLILDLLRGGDLFFHLDQTLAHGNAGFPEDKARIILAEVSLGLRHLHRCGFLHLDIKIENIMIHSSGHIKIVDFGLAQEVPATLEIEMKPRGSLLYMAPELLSLNVAGRFTDWWAIGVLAFELFTARSPWSSLTNIRRIRAEIKSLPILAPVKLSPEGGGFVLKLLERDHLERLGTTHDSEVFSAPFFEGVDWGAMERGNTAPAFVPNEGDVVVDCAYASDSLEAFRMAFSQDLEVEMAPHEKISLRESRSLSQ
jgi:serine/threonine protein kinase